MKKVLTRKFFERPAPEVAMDLLGKYIIRKRNGVPEAYIITETEAYEGPKDKASHASKGRTKRTEVMFGKPGVFYIYLVYGMYNMLNIVTGREGYPSAVLVRAAVNISGPGRLTKVLNIGGEFNKQPAILTTGLWFEDRGKAIRKKDIQKTSRIGIAYAGPIWSKKLWRFVYRDTHN